MPWRRLRDGVVLIAVGEERSLVGQLPQSSRQLALPAAEVVGPQLVDGDDDNELRPCGRRHWDEQPAQEGEIDGERHGQKVAVVRPLPPPGRGAVRGRRESPQHRPRLPRAGTALHGPGWRTRAWHRWGRRY